MDQLQWQACLGGTKRERENLEGKWPLDDLEYIDKLTPMPPIKQPPCKDQSSDTQEMLTLQRVYYRRMWGLTLIAFTSEEPSFSQHLPTARPTHSIITPLPCKFQISKTHLLTLVSDTPGATTDTSSNESRWAVILEKSSGNGPRLVSEKLLSRVRVGSTARKSPRFESSQPTSHADACAENHGYPLWLCRINSDNTTRRAMGQDIRNR